ncbi:unnamed protein product, partial [Schistosoma turkestanicum]
ARGSVVKKKRMFLNRLMLICLVAIFFPAYLQCENVCQKSNTVNFNEFKLLAPGVQDITWYEGYYYMMFLFPNRPGKKSCRKLRSINKVFEEFKSPFNITFYGANYSMLQ